MEEKIKVDAYKLLNGTAQMLKTAKSDTPFLVIVKTGKGKASVNISATGGDLVELTQHAVCACVRSLKKVNVPDKVIITLLGKMCAEAIAQYGGRNMANALESLADDLDRLKGIINKDKEEDNG